MSLVFLQNCSYKKISVSELSDRNQDNELGGKILVGLKFLSSRG